MSKRTFKPIECPACRRDLVEALVSCGPTELVSESDYSHVECGLEQDDFQVRCQKHGHVLLHLQLTPNERDRLLATMAKTEPVEDSVRAARIFARAVERTV